MISTVAVKGVRFRKSHLTLILFVPLFQVPVNMGGGQVCLKWNSFHSSLASGFKTLWEEDGLVDVTLASDGRCIQAHKLILSACSPFFREVFKVILISGLLVHSVSFIHSSSLKM